MLVSVQTEVKQDVEHGGGPGGVELCPHGEAATTATRERTTENFMMRRL